MTITVTIAIPIGWDRSDAEINQWVEDQTKHRPDHYIVRAKNIKHPRMQISRPDGTENSYRLTGTGDWVSSDFDLEIVDDEGEV